MANTGYAQGKPRNGGTLTPRENLEAAKREHAARSKRITNETSLKHAIIEVLSARGYKCWVINSGQILLRGRAVQLMPTGSGDIQGMLRNGLVYFLEVKKPGEKQNEAELEWERVCKEHGVPYAVVETIDDAVSQVRRWADG
jgi:hypothetical protein